MNNKWIIVVILVILILVGWGIYQKKLTDRFLENDPSILRLKNKLLPFFPEIANTLVLKGNKSYTVRKFKIHLCIEDENGRLYDDNMLTYVFLHELAHCLNTKELGHG